MEDSKRTPFEQALHDTGCQVLTEEGTNRMATIIVNLYDGEGGLRGQSTVELSKGLHPEAIVGSEYGTSLLYYVHGMMSRAHHDIAEFRPRRFSASPSQLAGLTKGVAL